MYRSWTAHYFIAIAAAILLQGCAGIRAIDSTVETYSELKTVAPGTTYRFDRLPLAQADPAAQATLEAMGAESLAKVGLVQVQSDPRYTAQVSATVARQDAYPWGYPYADPWSGWRFGVGFGSYWGGGPWAAWPGVGVGFYGMPPPPPRFQREVNVVLREARDGKVVFQSRAASDSTWWDSNAALPAMFDAALEGFPTPPAGVRWVRTPLTPADARRGAVPAPAPAPVTAPIKP